MANEQQTDPLAHAKSWERQHQDFEQRFPKELFNPQKAKGRPLQPNQKSIYGNPWAANAPQPAPRPPLNPALEEIRKRIERGEMKMPDAPVPSQPYQVPGENLSATDPKQQTERIAERQEQHKSMLDDLKEFINKHEHIGLLGINQLIQALNPVTSAQAGEVVQGNFLKRGIDKDLQKTPEQRKTADTLTRALGGATVLPINPTEQK